MSLVDALVQELEQEGRTTRRVIARVPADRLTWKPHDKSMSLGQLALHVAMLPGAIAQAAQQSPFPAPNFIHPQPASASDLMPTLDSSLATARDYLRGLDDAGLAREWNVVDGNRVLMTMTIRDVVRTLMLNHWYHHRGQLLVYLRQTGAQVPSVYGPSADENPFAPKAASAPA